MHMVKYRFYILNGHNNITDVHVAECDYLVSIERAANDLLVVHFASAAVQVWDRDRLVLRAERTRLLVS